MFGGKNMWEWEILWSDPPLSWTRTGQRGFTSTNRSMEGPSVRAMRGTASLPGRSSRKAGAITGRFGCPARSTGGDGRKDVEPTWSRRDLWIYPLAWASALEAWSRIGSIERAEADPVMNKKLQKAFEEAFAAGDNLELAIQKWSKAIDIDPDNSLAWANRGTVRLQALQWAGAASDLETAKVIEENVQGQASALTLINLGNSKVPLGDLEGAKECFLMAAEASKELESIALANYALVSFEDGDEESSIRTVRRLLSKDPNFWDARAALTAFLWAVGEEAQAEEQWTTLQEKGDSVAAALYPSCNIQDLVWPQKGAPLCGSLKRVAGRWPPRATAALGAFLGASRTGEARGYDGVIGQYSFG